MKKQKQYYDIEVGGQSYRYQPKNFPKSTHMMVFPGWPGHKIKLYACNIRQHYPDGGAEVEVYMPGYEPIRDDVPATRLAAREDMKEDQATEGGEK